MNVEDVKRIKARVKVDDTGFTLLQLGDRQEWQPDSQILNVQSQFAIEFQNTRQVNYAKVFEEMASLEKTVQECANQYEERLNRSFN